MSEPPRPSVIFRYAVVQLPSALLLGAILYALVRWDAIPAWLGWTILGLWLAKDIALYPLVRRSYHPEPHIPGQSLLGKRGVARERLAPTGYILVQGELWRAEAIGGKVIVEGRLVEVKEVQGLTLLVQEVSEEENGRS